LNNIGCYRETGPPVTPRGLFAGNRDDLCLAQWNADGKLNQPVGKESPWQ
jgi:hypothetical protein